MVEAQTGDSMRRNIFEVYIRLLSSLAMNLLYRSMWQMKTTDVIDTLVLPILDRTMDKALINITCSVTSIYP